MAAVDTAFGNAAVDATLAALADPTRRAVVGVLSRGPRSPSDIADELSTSRPVMSRHLRALREAGIVRGEIRADDARVRVYRLLPGPFDALGGWLGEVEAFWGDQVRASVRVAAEQGGAFRLFTEEIDRWWLRGLKYRVAGRRRGIIALEARLGGRLYESFDTDDGPIVVHTGDVILWEPPARIVLEWRAVNFAADEKTEVEITFEPSEGGTLVTVTHRGWSAIRPDHPVRHGFEEQPFLRMFGLWWRDLMESLRELVKEDLSAP